MNIEKKIEQCLKAVSKPPTPDGLLDKLQADVSYQDIEKQRPVLHKWFAPTGDKISPWRVAALVTIATMVLIPLTYAGSKIIKAYIFTEGPVVEVIENEDGSVTKVGSISVSIGSEDISDEQEFEAAREEIEELRKAGKYERTLLKQWEEKGMRFSLYKVSYTLSNGKVITVNEIEGGSIPN